MSVRSRASAEPSSFAASLSSWDCACGTSRQTTVAPSLAMTSAMALPMPLAEPVTNIFLPERGADQSLSSIAAFFGFAIRITCPET